MVDIFEKIGETVGKRLLGFYKEDEKKPVQTTFSEQNYFYPYNITINKDVKTPELKEPPELKEELIKQNKKPAKQKKESAHKNILPEKYLRVKPKGKKTVFGIYLITKESTIHTKVIRHNIKTENGELTLYYLAYNGYNYIADEMAENTEYARGRLDNIERLGQVGGNVLFLDDGLPNIRSNLSFGDIDLCEEAWAEISTLDKSKTDDQVAETTVNENELKYINPETQNLLIYTVIFAILAAVLFSQWMGNQGAIGAIVDRLCHPALYINTTNSSFVNGSMAVGQPQNSTIVVKNT